LPLHTALKMAAFQQNKPKIFGCNDPKYVLENVPFSDIYCVAKQTDIEEANLLNSRDKHEEAYRIYKTILKRNPRHAGALLGVGVILQKQEKFGIAIQFLSRSIEADPSNSHARLTRGRIYRLQGMSANAISDFTDVISNDPENFEAFIARGITFGQASRYHEAITDFSQAIDLKRKSAEAFYNRGVAFEKIRKLEAAIEDYSAAIKLNPTDGKAYNNRGLAFRELKKFEDAINDLREVVKIDPSFADAKFNLALTLLMTKNFSEGWQLYENRWETSNFPSAKRNFFQPLWLGKESLEGKSILIHSEQGLGDTLQFCRYLNLLKNLNCEVYFEVEQSLVRIISSNLNAKNIIPKGDDLPPFDFHCPLMSLPLAFGTTPETIPVSGPYLFPDNRSINFWRQYLGAKKRLRIGIAWQGNPKHPRDVERSIRLQDLLRYAPKNIDWYALQKDVSDQDQITLSQIPNAHYFGGLIGDFNSTAALCLNLDAIVSVDTSIAHLAGAVGSKTFLILPFISDARWFSSGTKTPWYQSMEIIRQDRHRSWTSVLRILIRKLRRIQSQGTFTQN